MSWAAVIAAGGAIIGGALSSSGATSAADTQAAGARYAADIGKQEFNTITAQEQPYLQGGYGALNSLEYLLGIPSTGPSFGPSAPGGTPFGPGAPGAPGGGGGPLGFGTFGSNSGNIIGMRPGGTPIFGLQPGPGGGPLGAVASGNLAGNPAVASNLGKPPTGYSEPGGFGSLLAPFTADTFHQMSPGYGFALQQGGQGVLNQMGPSQGEMSGAALKDFMSFNSGLANQWFNNAFNQYQTQQSNVYNRLFGLTQLGSSSAANLGAQGTALSGNIGSAYANAAASQAAGQVGSANAWSGALQSAIPWLQSAVNKPTPAPVMGY